MNTRRLILLSATSAIALSGCVPVVVTGAATTTGVVAAQERSTGNAMDDAGIKLTIDNLYFNKDINDLFKNVNIHVSEGRVLLTGAVDKPDTKIEAVRLAWRATGVREVIDEIQVNDKSGFADYARDSWICAQIRGHLLVEKNLRSINYNVECVNGVVYLMGIAQDEDELHKATYIASTTRYVKQVVSHVILKTDPRRRVYLRQTQDDKPQPKMHGGADGQSSGQPETYGGGGQPESYQHGTDSEQESPGGTYRQNSQSSGQPESFHRDQPDSQQ